tara:strand:- start:186 stop:413 length:228 start_codon:yes stop_codon:yes gene_type:complete
LGIKHNLGKVKLNISAIDLGTTEVVAEESIFIQTIDKKIFNVGRDLSSPYGFLCWVEWNYIHASLCFLSVVLLLV